MDENIISITEVSNEQREEKTPLEMAQDMSDEIDKMIDKRDPVVLAMKTWIDEEYENGRQTMLSDGELEQKLRELSAKLGN